MEATSAKRATVQPAARGQHRAFASSQAWRSFAGPSMPGIVFKRSSLPGSAAGFSLKDLRGTNFIEAAGSVVNHHGIL